MLATARIEGTQMDRLVVARRPGSPDLSGRAAVQYHAALSRLPWADAHRRVVGVFDGGGALLATAERQAFAGALDGTPVRLCLIGGMTGYAATDDDPVRRLVDALLDEATGEGVDLAVIVGDRGTPVPATAYPVPTQDVTLRVTESPRRGAPMVPVRSGEHADFAAMARMPVLGAVSRLRLDRTADCLEFCVIRARLRAGLDRHGARQMRFLVAEEGGRAAAYVVISVIGATWIVEACGDFDASGARVGAMLQTLIAEEPVERRPLIRAWWPSPVMPPQVTEASAEASADQLWVQPLAGATAAVATAAATLTARAITLWRGDLP